MKNKNANFIYDFMDAISLIGNKSLIEHVDMRAELWLVAMFDYIDALNNDNIDVDSCELKEKEYDFQTAKMYEMLNMLNILDIISIIKTNSYINISQFLNQLMDEYSLLQ